MSRGERDLSINTSGKPYLNFMISVDVSLMHGLLLGEALYELLKITNARKNKNNTMSVGTFCRSAANHNPAKSAQTYRRAYEVYEKFVVNAGIGMHTLKCVSHSTLAEIAQTACTPSPTIRGIANGIIKRLNRGESQKEVRVYACQALNRQRSLAKRLRRIIKKYDAQIAAGF